MVRSAVPQQIADEMRRAFDEVEADPTGDKRIGGASHRWWADAVDVTPARTLPQTSAPVLLVHGAKDRSAPVATARATRDLFTRAGKDGFTYREYAGYDHDMRDAAGVDRTPDVLRDAAAWLERHGLRRAGPTGPTAHR